MWSCHVRRFSAAIIFSEHGRRRAPLYISSGFLFPDYGSVPAGQAGNDREDQPHQSRDLCQLHPLQHALWGSTLTTETASLWNSPEISFSELFLRFFRFVLQLKKDPDSPEATPPSTPGSSHTSKPLLQGNGSLDGRARQRKRKKVCNWTTLLRGVEFWFCERWDVTEARCIHGH